MPKRRLNIWDTYRKMVVYRQWLMDNKTFIIQSTQPQRRPYITNKLYGQIYDVSVMLKEMQSVMTIEFVGNIEDLLMTTCMGYNTAMELKFKYN